jgi:hypothetical protein
MRRWSHTAIDPEFGSESHQTRGITLEVAVTVQSRLSRLTLIDPLR